MRIEPLRDRARIEAFLRLDAAAHVYPIADLDDPFWDDTHWYGGLDGDRLESLCLVLQGLRIPILYAVCPDGHEPTLALVRGIVDALPDRFFYNLGPGGMASLASFELAPEGRYWKMALSDSSPCEAVPPKDVEPLGPDDFDELRAFLDHDAYLPHETGGLFFERRMLETGCYRGIRENGRLVALGGVHVHSPRLGVAGIGNVVTRPNERGRGLARRVSAAVVRAVRESAQTIGLNVHEANAPAIRCYEGLGFRRVCPYDEGVAERRSRAS